MAEGESRQTEEEHYQKKQISPYNDVYNQSQPSYIPAAPTGAMPTGAVLPPSQPERTPPLMTTTSSSITVDITSCKPKGKSVFDAYIIAVSLGLVGGHHFYLHRPGWGILYFFTFGLFGVGWMADLFRMPYLVKKTNQHLQERPCQVHKDVNDAVVMWLPPHGLLGKLTF